MNQSLIGNRPRSSTWLLLDRLTPRITAKLGPREQWLPRIEPVCSKITTTNHCRFLSRSISCTSTLTKKEMADRAWNAMVDWYERESAKKKTKRRRRRKRKGESAWSRCTWDKKKGRGLKGIRGEISEYQVLRILPK